jgi:hypothetical protein
MLASKDILLVLRVSNSDAHCDEYWALVPPVAEQQPVKPAATAEGDSQSLLLHGLDFGESERRHSHPVIEGDTNQGGGRTGPSAAAVAVEQHMVLVKLVDRDELLLDSCAGRISVTSNPNKGKRNDSARNENAMPGGEW